MGFCSSCGEIVRSATGKCTTCGAGVAVDSATSGLDTNATSASIADKYADKYLSSGFRGGVSKGLGEMLGIKQEKNCDEYCIDCQRHITDSAEIFVGPTHLGSHVYCESCYGKKHAKGQCEACHKPVLGLGKEYVNQDNKFWHKECFLANPSESGARSCAECYKVILGQGVSALSKWYHPECFKCFNCQTVINGSFVDFNGNPCCKLCNASISSKRPDVAVNSGSVPSTSTAKYNEEIKRQNEAISKANQNKTDFINNKTVGDLENICDECFAPIKSTPSYSSTGITNTTQIVKLTNGLQFHPGCFKCQECQRPISDAKYVLEGRSAYHPGCRVLLPKKINGPGVRVAGNPGRPTCKGCSTAITSQFMKLDGDVYHPQCFKCVLCKNAIGTNPFGELPGRGPACESCLTKPIADSNRTITKTITTTGPRVGPNKGNTTIAYNAGGFTINPITGAREERLPGGALKNPQPVKYGQ